MEKHLIILSIIIIIIVIYCLFCNQKDNKETFTSSMPCNADITTLANLARDLQLPTGILIPKDLNIKFRHILMSNNDDWLKIKSYTNLSENANMAVRNLNVDGSFNLLPRGMITVWNKPVAPIGWAFCDGSMGTPDLRGRFILGQVPGKNLNTKDGRETMQLTIDEMPSHTHKCTQMNATWKGGKGGTGTLIPAYNSVTLVDGEIKGGGLPFDKMPPYYVLAYIMKL